MSAESLRHHLERVNKEIWLVLSLFAIAAFLNLAVTGSRMVLAFYTLPTIGSAYLYGRRHATLTAVASVLLVILLMRVNTGIFAASLWPGSSNQWVDIAVWGLTLIVTAYSMGTLYGHKSAQLRELQETYHGILIILRHFLTKDQYTENHSYRVSVYATKIALEMQLAPDQIENVRSAALLHDIGKLDVSRGLLYKAAQLTEDEFKEMRLHVDKGVAMLEPLEVSLKRVLPIILSHHDKFDGSGYHPTDGENIPLEARIISVADVFDSLTSDRPYRKAMSPYEVREILKRGSGTEFDPQVVDAFLSAFKRGRMEMPVLVV
jgi:putative nucleotidyltransferase with HDIG domain